MGHDPDGWQRDVLESSEKRQAMLCTRQAGKSTTTAARVLNTAYQNPGRDCLVFSPTLRQSMELLRKVNQFHHAVGRVVRAVSANKTAVEFANGARVFSLPDSHKGVVGFSAPKLIVIDEASRVSDDLYKSVRPMLATAPDAELVVLSTPFGQRGWFFDLFDDSAEARQRRGDADPWTRTRVTADRCPRISAAFLDEERVELGDRWFRQEYYCSFEEAADAVFASGTIAAAADSDAGRPLFLGVA